MSTSIRCSTIRLQTTTIKLSRILLPIRIHKMGLISMMAFLWCGFAATSAYKILIMHPTPSYSHQLPVMALTEALVKKGHEVFVVSPNVVPGLEKNYTYVDVSFTYNIFSPDVETETKIDLQKQLTKWEVREEFRNFIEIVGIQFKSDAFLQFQRKVKAEKIVFDVIMSESYYVPYTCAMSRYLTGGKPIIAMATITTDWYSENSLGSKVHLSYVPSLMDPYTDHMSIWQKIESWYSTNLILNSFAAMTEDMARDFFTKNYGPEYASLVDGCWTNISLAMLSSNPLYFYPRPLSPNVVELGPLHIRPPEKLPQNLQDWLDGAEKGVIYFSLGSNMKSISLPMDVRSNFLRVFKELPTGYRVLWKWELDGKIPGQSDNILSQKWTPQQSVLAHPKVKVFMTQGGLQSFQETVHHGVPLVGIPWFGDQESNVAKMVSAGIGVRLAPQELYSYDKIKSALEKVLFDESYAKNMKRLSAISHDFTPSAVENGVFWIEHVARHGGAAHFRPSTADTTLFQYLCLDILSVILAIVIAALFFVISVFRFLLSSVSRSSTPKPKTS